MARLEEVYLSQQERDNLAREFFQSYEDDYWYAKIQMYDYLLENLHSVFEAEEGVTDEDLEDYRRLVKSEFTYMFYHSTEALIGLVRSLVQDGFPWIDLKETYSGDITSFAENELEEEGIDEELRMVFYPIVDENNENGEEELNQSIEVIKRYLVRIGRRYDDRDMYNEYKHGLRLITDEREVEIGFPDRVDDSEEGISDEDGFRETEDGVAWSALSGDVFLSLEVKKWGEDEDGEELLSLSRKIRSLEFELHRSLCKFNSQLISHIFYMYRCLAGVLEEEDLIGGVPVYDEADLADVFDVENPLQELSMNVYFPRDKDDVFLYEVR